MMSDLQKFSVVISTVGRAHLFALARELERGDYLEAIYSGFPWGRLAREQVSRERVRTFPWVRPLIFGVDYLPTALRPSISDGLHRLSLATLDRYVSATLPESDIFVGHEGVGLLSGTRAKQRGALYVCDRGCSHIAWQRDVLAAEYDRMGLPPPKAPPSMTRELEEYDIADHIVIPSKFAQRSFVEQGFPASKLSVVGYGAEPVPISERRSTSQKIFRVLFAGQLSVRKGAGDVLRAFQMIDVAEKRLVIAGAINPEIQSRFAAELASRNVEALGVVSRKRLREVMSESDILVLPSIEDGFGMVVTEAAACGCPAIVSENTGAADFIIEGVNGFVVPIRRPDIIAERLQQMAADPDIRVRLSQGALERVQSQAGWGAYGENMVATFAALLSSR